MEKRLDEAFEDAIEDAINEAGYRLRYYWHGGVVQVGLGFRECCRFAAPLDYPVWNWYERGRCRGPIAPGQLTRCSACGSWPHSVIVVRRTDDLVDRDGCPDVDAIRALVADAAAAADEWVRGWPERAKERALAANVNSGDIDWDDVGDGVCPHYIDGSGQLVISYVWPIIDRGRVVDYEWDSVTRPIRETERSQWIADWLYDENAAWG